MSRLRSRSGGIRSLTTLRRKYKSLRKAPICLGASRSRLVAANIRALIGTDWVLPTAEFPSLVGLAATWAASQPVVLRFHQEKECRLLPWPSGRAWLLPLL
jgi:hypothetical protein